MFSNFYFIRLNKILSFCKYSFQKSGIEYLKAEDPDVFCLQETKCDKSKIPPKAELAPYHCYWASGDTQGYSGVGLLSKVKPMNVTFGISEENILNI